MTFQDYLKQQCLVGRLSAYICWGVGLPSRFAPNVVGPHFPIARAARSLRSLCHVPQITFIHPYFWHALEHRALMVLEISHSHMVHVCIHRLYIVLSFAQIFTMTIWFALSTYLSYMGFARVLTAAIRLVVASLFRDGFN